MPELPEVETVRRTLAPALGAKVQSVWFSGMPLRLNRGVDEGALRRATVGAKLEVVRRWGKYLLLDFAGQPTVPRAGDTVIVHLGMSGRLRLVLATDARAPHTHIVWRLAGRGAGWEMRFSDPRRFGFVGVCRRGYEREHPALAELGADPIEHGLGGAALHELTTGSRQPIKTLLLDQTRIAGVGNIYASEALWLARVRPMMRAHQLTRPRADALAKAVRDVLVHALTHGGTSLRDFVSAAGEPGDYHEYLRVYDREGLPCLRAGCGTPIRRLVIQGRATFYCPTCQQR